MSRPAKTAVTGAGAVGYESGSQADRGKIAALMPNASSSRSWIASAVPGSISAYRSESWARLTVPVAA
ncbi:Uncharacterised protein [Mycobacteroides abscessus]|nr:Uncharacterised protein [Mycobacteroides abscessus]